MSASVRRADVLGRAITNQLAVAATPIAFAESFMRQPRDVQFSALLQLAEHAETLDALTRYVGRLEHDLADRSAA